MTKFKIPQRFDRKAANDGREIYVTDTNGVYWGTFRVALVEPSMPRYRMALERLKRKYQNNGPKGKPANLNESFAAELFVELALLDWSGIEDANGKAVPFSKEAAVEYFTITETDDDGETYYPMAWLVGELSREAENLANFQPVDQQEPAEKN